MKIAAPTPIRLPLARGEAIAAKIVESLAEFSEPERIVVAGSIRRQRPEVGDIDIVLMPREPRSLSIDQIRKKIRAPLPHVVEDGGVQLLVIFADARTVKMYGGPLQLDLWFAVSQQRDMFSVTPTNWGSLLLCRTGSPAHNVRICTVAKRRGWHWNPYSGLYDGAGKCIAGETEESIYAALELPFLAPEERER